MERGKLIHEEARPGVIVLDENLVPDSVIYPCPAVVLGPFLGSDASKVRCAGIQGHDGVHYWRIEWESGSRLEGGPR